MQVTEFNEQKAKHHQLVDEVITLLKSESFHTWCREVHASVDYQSLAKRLESFNLAMTLSTDELQSLQPNYPGLSLEKINMVEWYFKCQQVNADLVVNLLGSLASHITESLTRAPIISKISDIIDKMIIAGLDVGHFIAKHIKVSDKLGTDKHPMLSDTHALMQWYREYVQPSLHEIADAVHSIRNKHELKQSLDPSQQRMSALAAAITITGALIKLQARIVTGLCVQPAKYSGHVVNDVIAKLQTPDMIQRFGSIIRGLIQIIIKLPVEAEAHVLKEIAKINDVKHAIEDLAIALEPENRPKP